MEGFLDFIHFVLCVTAFIGFLLFWDFRKVDRRFKNGYKNNEEKDPEVTWLGIKILLASLPILFIISSIRGTDSPASSNYAQKEEIQKWQYIQQAYNTSGATIGTEQLNLTLLCNKTKQQIQLAISTSDPIDKDQMKQNIQFDSRRSIASTKTTLDTKNPTTIFLDKSGLKEDLLKSKQVHVTLHGQNKTFNYSFSLKNSKATISRVINDCNGKW